VRRDIKKGRAKWQGVAAGAEGGVGADHPKGCWWDGGQVSQTLDAVLQKGQTMPEKNRFPAVLQPLSHWDGSDVHPTLNQSAKGSGDQSPHIAYPVVPLDGMNLLSRLGPCGEEHSIQNFTPGDPSFTLKKGGNQHGVLTPMAVRRLTPVETERLQGFPDNWSRISWKGKPEEQCPDGPRYKACGNSMAVPVMRWIGERIAAADAKHFPNA
jgi:site-specific DNA-cytosine methylase